MKVKVTLEYTLHGPVRDAAIIAIVQKIAHYAIAAMEHLWILVRFWVKILLLIYLIKRSLRKKKQMIII
jgi:hypothetical protein